MELFVRVSDKNQITPDIITAARYIIMDAEELMKIPGADTRPETIPLHKRCAALPTVLYEPDALKQLHNTLTILLCNGVKAFYIPNLYGFTAILEAAKQAKSQEFISNHGESHSNLKDVSSKQLAHNLQDVCATQTILSSDKTATPALDSKLLNAMDITLIAGSELNIANHEAIAEYTAMGSRKTVLTPEITAHQTRRLARKYSVGIYAYGRLPLMTYRHCPLSVHGCPPKSKDTQSHPCALTDRTGRVFPFQCNTPGGVSKMLNSHPLWIADKISSFNGISFALLHFTIEDATACTRVAKAFLQGEAPPKDMRFTRGLYFRKV